MALSMEERRRLADIELRLTADDPRLAARLADLGRRGRRRRVRIVVAIVVVALAAVAALVSAVLTAVG